MNTPYISTKKFVEWVHAQPDDRPLNMREIRADSKCGCLMVQYAREQPNFPKFQLCGWSAWLDDTPHIVAQLDSYDLSDCIERRPTTFGEAKVLLPLR